MGPKLGDRVLFQFSQADGPRGGQFLQAAIITKVISPVAVNVTVFCADGQVLPYTEVYFADRIPDMGTPLLRACFPIRYA